MSVRWVVQLGLGKNDDALMIESISKKLGYECELLKIIPFSETLPNVPTEMPTIFYGGTNWISLISKSKLWHPAAWFDEDDFRFSTTLKKYQKHMLNSDAEVLSFEEFIERSIKNNTKDDEQFFIRPDRDIKEFAGDVITYGQFSDWFETISYGGYSITKNTQIIVANPVGISAEWRCFMVDKRVSSASRYRSNRTLDICAGAPDDVISFAENMASIWSPADVFVLDVGKSGSNYYVIETNCFNSAGFYACDIGKIIKDVSNVALRGV